jgi:FixJ family two-component response regulator
VISQFITVIDDDDAVRDSVGTLLEAHGFSVKSFASGPEFLQSDAQQQTVCLLLDYHMPEMTGIDLLIELKRRGLSYPTILITGLSDGMIQKRAYADPGQGDRRSGSPGAREPLDPQQISLIPGLFRR